MWQYIIYIGGTAIILILLPFVPFPDIPPQVFDFPIQISRQIWYFNKFVAIDTLFQMVGLIIVIEFLIYLWTWVAKTIRGKHHEVGFSDDKDKDI